MSESGLKDFRICKISPRAILFNNLNPTNHGSDNLNEGFALSEAFIIAKLSESGLKDFKICKISPRAILFNHLNPTNHGSDALLLPLKPSFPTFKTILLPPKVVRCLGKCFVPYLFVIRCLGKCFVPHLFVIRCLGKCFVPYVFQSGASESVLFPIFS